ncbi:ATP-binding protein [Treponema primitia]|uniref:ATP-binding protein n=1 Tax=Treponema primitia TaxID=88058 RepID=UPI00397F086A
MASVLNAEPQNSSLYVDLRTCPLYVKSGFSPADILSRPDNSSGAWRVIEDPAASMLVRDLGLPDVPHRRFLSPFGRPVQEFTFLIPFSLPSGTALGTDTMPIPGLYLASIGDNWEIYLNGHIVKSEMHLDPDGSIISYRSMRKIFFPLDRSLFIPGENILGFRIVGDPTSGSAGLFYISPYYIDEYAKIAMRYNEFLTAAFIGVYVLVGIYHLLMFFTRKEDRYNMYYSLLSGITGLYFFMRTYFVYQLIPDTVLIWHLEYFSAFMILPLGTFFLESFFRKKIRRVTWIYCAVCVLLALIQITFSRVFMDDVLRLWQMVFMPAGLLLIIYDIGRLVVLAYQEAKKHTPGGMSFLSRFAANIFQESAVGSLIIGIVIALGFAVFDVLDSLFLHYSLTLSRYSFFVFVAGATMIMIRRIGFLYNQLDDTNTVLEDTNQTLEQQLKALMEAERVSQAKSSFLANTSHEIRTPMNAILGMTELILRKDISPDVYEDALSIKQAGSNLLSVINDILDFSKIESGKLDLVESDYQLGSVINDVISIVRTRLSEKPILFTVDIDGKLPDHLIGDEVRFRQILMNLLSNAVKYTREGRIILVVNGEVQDDRIILAVSVTDTGIGIKPEDMDKLFSEFQQLDTHKNKSIDGTGLGLAISRNLCRLMGGDITVSSVYGKGSVFAATIPQGILDPEPLAAIEDPETKMVLLYESRREYAESLVRSFVNLGVPVTAAVDAEGLVRELLGNPYSFAFVCAPAVEEAQSIIQDLSLPTKLVFLASQGEISSFKNIPIISMPAHTLSLANMINEKTYASYHNKSGVRFTAPDVRLLIVDDIVTNLVVAKGLLSVYQVDIDIATSGRKAIELIQKNRYDLVFIDHMMPEMDGIETTAAIRALEASPPMEASYFQTLPIIALTANAMTGMKEMFLSKGFNDYLSKPIEISKLDGMMHKWIPPEKRVKPAPETDEEGITETTDIYIDGVDTAKGIDLTGGTEEGYRNILQIFCLDAASQTEYLKSVPAVEQMPLFINAVHSIKGIAASIGADTLSSEALTLEMAGKNLDMETITRHLADFTENLLVMTERIQAFLKGP